MLRPSKRASARRRAEAKVIGPVREQCVERDGYCRLNGRRLGYLAHHCEGPSEWAHLGEKKRAKTRGMAPEDRHTTAGSLMLCKKLHDLYDAGKLEIEELTERGANGFLRFEIDGHVIDESKSRWA